MNIRDALAHLVRGGTLDQSQAEGVFESLLTGGADDVQIAGLLSLIQRRGATVDELVGAAMVMRRHVTHIPARDDPARPIVDTCGTGGAPKTFNVSTCAAIVAAAAAEGKLRIAKHGNRSRTGRGSAEILAALGVNVDALPEVQARCLDEVGVCFCFAIHHHPAVKHAMPARKSLGFPTIFNLLGPLTNPAGASRQLIGVYERNLVSLVASALARLGAEHAMVVHGEDGLDEITTTAPTHAAVVRGGRVETRTIDAAEHGVARGTLAGLQVADLDGAVATFRSVLAGEPGPAREIVLVNAGAALVVGGVAGSLREGVAMASEAIGRGSARECLAHLVRASR